MRYHLRVNIRKIHSKFIPTPRAPFVYNVSCTTCTLRRQYRWPEPVVSKQLISAPSA